MHFEDLPSTPSASMLLDKAFSRAARAGRASGGVDAQRSMVTTAGNILGDNLANVVRTWPDLDGIDPFYREVTDAVVGLDALRQDLARVHWASRQVERISREAIAEIAADRTQARATRKRAFARMASVVEDVEDSLERLEDARRDLGRLPGIDPETPTIVVAGSPNVGKSTFVNAVTNARNEVAAYPFTTTGIHVGHVDHRHVRYQLVDTPGLLDRPADERNDVEAQAVSALTHLADAVLVVLDPTETCGYPMTHQRRLLASIEHTFDDIPVLTVCNKADLEAPCPAAFEMSATDEIGTDTVLEAAIEAIGYEPDLPTLE